MKRFFAAAALIAGCLCSQAQDLGIKAGVNFSNFGGGDADGFNVLTGFHAGIFTEVQLLKHLSFQPELLYSKQGAKRQDAEYELNYLNVPAVFKLYLNEGFNIQAGPQFGLLISESDNFNGFNSKTYDLGVALGAEFYIADGLFVQGRYIYGTSSVSSERDIKNTGIQVSLGYQF